MTLVTYVCTACHAVHTTPRVWLTGAHRRVSRCDGWYVTRATHTTATPSGRTAR